MVSYDSVFEEECEVLSNRRVGKYHEITFSSKRIAKAIKVGQFVNIKLDRVFFRRPYTLLFKDNGKFSILVKVVGRGSKELSEITEGKSLSIIGPLGNSVFDFDITGSESVSMVAGGVGIANMVSLAMLLKNMNEKSRLFWGIKSKDEFFDDYLHFFDEVFISSEDGGVGYKGFITDVFREKYGGEFVYACGPLPMYKAMKELRLAEEKVLVSLETVMGCGIGVCYGCSTKTLEGYKLVCKDGPNFRLSELVL
jgi:dihydroorotate dehydrogenase electron transfer subunit